MAEGAAEEVVFFVVEGVLEVVAAADGGFAVGGVGFVGVEVDFFEESRVGLLDMGFFFMYRERRRVRTFARGA